MGINFLIKYFLYSILTIVCSVSFAEQSFADYSRISSHIKIVNPLNVEEVSKLNFGTIEKPTQSSVISLGYNGNLISSDANIIDQQTISGASYSISGSENNNIEINVAYIENEEFISIGEMNGIFDGIEGDLKNGINNVSASEEGKTLNFGADLTILEGITEGSYQPQIILSVNYE